LKSLDLSNTLTTLIFTTVPQICIRESSLPPPLEEEDEEDEEMAREEMEDGER